ncbi:hypothetical protein [Streptomyces sp. CRN 30]|uniref:hypothetical protein n=1 Tax=Streptomyces sp. CRN 30 TaxID=3075613 RepID=UPI002A807D14|nr:hypothetical protein [Streptomyces sp. CRN 30]
MITDTGETPARRPETGWSKARARRGAGAVRTSLPAVEEAGGRRAPRPGPEQNIVRGED